MSVGQPTSPSPPPLPPRQPPEKDGSGRCLLYGCGGCALLAVVFVLVVALGGSALVGHVRDNYTGAEPVALPVLDVTNEEAAEVKARLAAFREAFDNGQPAEVELTARDLNALMANDPDIGGKVHFRITDEDELMVDTSLPLDDVPFMTGRYLNCSVGLRATVDGPGSMVVNVTRVEFRGEPLPAELMQGITEENFAKELREDPELAAVIDRLEELRIEDGRIILRAGSQP